jgi:bacteriorhodopsin
VRTPLPSKAPNKELMVSGVLSFFTLLNSFVFVSSLFQENPDFIARTMTLLSLWIIFGLFPFGLGVFLLSQRRVQGPKKRIAIFFFIQTLAVLMVLGLLIVAR